MIICEHTQPDDKVRLIKTGELLIVTEVLGLGVSAVNPETGEVHEFIGASKLERTR